MNKHLKAHLECALTDLMHAREQLDPKNENDLSDIALLDHVIDRVRGVVHARFEQRLRP